MSGSKLVLISLGLIIGAALLSATIGTFLSQLGVLRVMPVAVAIAGIGHLVNQRTGR